MIKNAQAIVKSNFKMATLDAIGFNYFCSEREYKNAENLIDAGVDDKMHAMSDDDIQAFALAVVGGYTIEFDIDNEDFFVSF